MASLRPLQGQPYLAFLFSYLPSFATHLDCLPTTPQIWAFLVKLVTVATWVSSCIFEAPKFHTRRSPWPPQRMRADSGVPKPTTTSVSVTHLFGLSYIPIHLSQGCCFLKRPQLGVRRPRFKAWLSLLKAHSPTQAEHTTCENRIAAWQQKTQVT